MSEKIVQAESFLAAIDLQSSQNCFVKISSGSGDWCTMCNTSGEATNGILLNNPKSGHACTVLVEGRTTLKGAATVTVGSRIKTNHSGMGLATTQTSGDYTNTQCVEALASTYFKGVLIRGTPMRDQ